METQKVTDSEASDAPVTPTSANSTKDDLDIALNGQEPTSKNLILAAIGVMKNRKARPDAKRISNWINRRYGRSLAEVEEELERLVSVGELARVDYKGSASFRIVQPEAKAKRRRRGTKPLGRTPSRTPVPLGGVFPPITPSNGPIEQNMPQSPILPPAQSPPPLTLRTLVIEMLGESATASIESGITMNTQFIAKAVESTNRNIYRAAVLGNLDLILAKEVEMGCFIKVGEDQYKISPHALPLQQHHSLMALNPPLAHPPPSPVPVQQLLLDPQSRSVMSPTAAASGAAESPTTQAQNNFSPMAPPPAPPPLPAINSPSNSASFPTNSDETYEQRKNDLIAAKLSKLEGKKSPNKKVVDKSNKHKQNNHDQFNLSSMVALEIKKEVKIELENELEDLPLTVARSNSMQSLSSAHPEMSNGAVKPKPSAKRKLKHSQDQQQHQGQSQHQQQPRIKVEVTDEDTTSPIPFGSEHNNSRISSSRKKKSRKIFDPADYHDQPVRKRKAQSPVSCASSDSLGGLGSHDTTSAAAAVVRPREGGCIYCGLSSQKQRKGGRLEALIRCNDCPTTVHPSCMDYSEKLIKKIFQSASWQCTNCKTCHVCQEANDDDCMLFCDSCDLGYHMQCHRPPLMEKPPGKWECCNCDLGPPPGSNNGISSHNTKTPLPKTAKDDETARFLPILPPHLHPHTGLLPDNWEDYEVDPQIPDVSEWEPIQIRDFFSEKGFSDALSNVFLQQEIDGRSLLLLHRSDVVSSLGLKLGPALKLFSFIKKLQTRRNFPDY